MSIALVIVERQERASNQWKLASFVVRHHDRCWAVREGWEGSTGDISAGIYRIQPAAMRCVLSCHACSHCL